MATTVRVDDETKASLEQLRAELTLATGRRLSIEETLHLLTKRAKERKDALLPELEDRPPRLTDAEWDRLLAKAEPWGGTVAPEDIDAIAGEDTAR